MNHGENVCIITFENRVLVMLSISLFMVLILSYSIFAKRVYHSQSQQIDWMEDRGKKQRPGDRLKKPKWDLSSLPQVVRNFYREHPSVSRRKDIAIQEFRKSRDINVKGRDVLKPIVSIEETNFPTHLLEQLQSSNIFDPTAIQCQGWPIALAGRNLVAVAETGSGKTLSYLLPGIVHATYQPFLAPDEGPIVVVLVPTRELAIQVG